MRIGFDDLDESVINPFYGGNGDTVTRMTVVDVNRIMRGRLEPGASIGTHPHNGSCETVFIVVGTGTAVCDGIEEKCPLESATTVRTDPRTR